MPRSPQRPPFIDLSIPCSPFQVFPQVMMDGGGSPVPPSNDMSRPTISNSTIRRIDAILPAGAHEPPRFTIDLSKKPEDRYAHVVPAMQRHLDASDLNGLFNEVIGIYTSPTLLKAVHMLARATLRRVYSREETAELKGISRATNVPMHLLVAFNVLLDLLLGCTSGGARVEEQPDSHSVQSPPSRMIHYRTLDWGMDPLRNLVICLDFIRAPGEPLIATSITYFGYVGVLTGVRQGLSMSMNFRPHHDSSSFVKAVRFRAHQLMVVFGRRRGIASVMRKELLRDDAVKKRQARPDKDPQQTERQEMNRILVKLRTSASTAAYLIFCTPQQVFSIEVDNRAASMTSSDMFLATCNHDLSDENDGRTLLKDVAETTTNATIGMEELVKWSKMRKSRAQTRFDRHFGKRRQGNLDHRAGPSGIRMEDLLKLLTDEEITNEETHYGLLMDPSSGQIVWMRAFSPP